MSAIIPAEIWNGLIAEVLRARVIAGIGCETNQTPDGCIISGRGTSRWRHPWQISARWRYDDTIQPVGGEWVAMVQPGFVNAQDVTIDVTSPAGTPNAGQSVPIPLTDENTPEIVIGDFRDPAAPGPIDDAFSENFTVAPGEGYPKFFDHLGVVPVAKGGSGLAALEPEPDPTRTRQIRACDIVLITPRMAARQTVTVLNPLTDSQSIDIGTAFDNTALRNAKSRHWLNAVSKWQPPMEPTDLDKLMGTAVEPQTDEIKLATLWMISPPDAGSSDEPDETWTPYPQHFVFWNLNHASRAQLPSAPPKPITLQTGLLGGLADSIFSQLLSPVNDAYAQVSAYLGAADFTGLYWST